jgi:hypothetical protein
LADRGRISLALSHSTLTSAWSPRRGVAVARWRPTALEAAGLGLLLAVAAWIFAIPLHAATNYDEGNYLAALTDLRHGFVLGKDVYADQPPGWYLLLRLLAWLFGNSLTGVRTGLLVLALAGVVAAWACARRLGPLPALGAAAVLVVAAPYPAQATQIEADTPAAVLAMIALALAVWAGRRGTSMPLAALAGALLACAISVKLSALTAVLPFAAIALPWRRRLLWPLLGVGAVFGAEVFAFRHELGPIARGAIGQHTSALDSSQFGRSANVHRLLHFLNSHTPLTWLVVAAVLASLWLALKRDPARRLLGALWLFLPAAVVFIFGMKPLLDHHLVILAVALALPSGAALGLAVTQLRREAGAAVMVAIAVLVPAGVFQQHRQLVRSSQPEPSWLLAAAQWMRAETAPREVVATDIPIIAYYAHRDLVPDFVDTSFTRMHVHDLTAAKVFADLARYHVRVAGIGRAFYADKAIRNGFTARFAHRILGHYIVFYLDRRSP